MNSDNKNLPVITIAVMSVVVLALGYFLFKGLPQNPSQNTNKSDPADSLIGKPVPDIQLLDKDGKVHTAADFKGKNTVLFFNEGLMCYPACWNQIASFGSDERFNSDQVQAISVVVDSAGDWQRAIAQMPELAKATTMFDVGANASRRLDILTMASSMHKGSLPGHTYIVLDKDAVVRYVFDDPNMAIANDMLFGKIEELSK